MRPVVPEKRSRSGRLSEHHPADCRRQSYRARSRARTATRSRRIRTAAALVRTGQGSGIKTRRKIWHRTSPSLEDGTEKIPPAPAVAMRGNASSVAEWYLPGRESHKRELSAVVWNLLDSQIPEQFFNVALQTNKRRSTCLDQNSRVTNIVIN
ncbi:hypothetical protein HPB50_025364 [Hyalomma asiaticum]|uniref:Uncharacterized protein n=1 Tax=Hyalomma asiaticum TaxID=266040 RepID=A0ACB7SZN0_HYAAI|nr:hypothetical protein HPB50_025364 [Hyalomma asiaticum]